MASENKSTEPVKILQITDTHLFAGEEGRLLGIDTTWTLQKVIDAVQKKGMKHDAVVVTGDLSQDVSRQSYLKLADMVNAFGIPSYSLPGNHDELEIMMQLKDTVALYGEREFSIGNWHVVLLNSAATKRVDGHLSGEELNWLDNCLSKHKDKHVLLAMHHQPTPVGSSWMDRICLDNSDALFVVLSRHSNVKAIIYGHVHQRHESSKQGIALMSCPSTCVQFKPDTDEFCVDTLMPGYRWLKLFQDGSIESGVERIDQVDLGVDPKARGY